MADNPAFVKEDEVDLRYRPHKDVQNEVTVIDIDSKTERVTSTDKQANDCHLDILYTITDRPPWLLCIFLGLQHYLTAFGGLLAIPLILAPIFCLEPDDVGTSELMCTLLFVSGIVTLLQSTFGTRLPIIQGGTFSFLAPTFAIMSLPKWQCPQFPDYSNTTLFNDSMRQELADYKQEVWHAHVREIQGAIILSSLFQIVIGATGLFGFLLRFIGPLSITPTIALVGLALFDAASNASEGQWWICIGTIVCVIVFSQLLSKYELPCYTVNRKADRQNSCVVTRRVPFFRMYPMLLSILLMWFICYILTVTKVLPSDPDKWGYQARTDIKIDVLYRAKWFRFPYPFQFGMPTFSLSGTFGMLAGVMAGMMESIGDYYACARLCGAPPPPTHAINRGIFVEGLGCMLSGMWGSGNGTTSYSENIGAIGITKVGSRIVIQTAGILMVCLGMLGKFGALFVTIPSPIIGGVFMVSFGMITSVGISNLQYVNMNSSRNLFVVGFSLFFGLSLPIWVNSHRNAINTGVPELDQILTVLLSTSMFVGGAVGFILDNMIPGTEEERGIKSWKQMAGEIDTTDSGSGLECYDLPWCMGCIRRVRLFRYLPFCPGFSLSCSCCPNRRSEDLDAATTTNNQPYVITTPM